MSLVLLAFLGILLFQDRYYWFSPSVWLDKLGKDYEYTWDDLFGTLWALNISVVFTVLGLILAMATFVLSRNKITFAAYLANFLTYDPVRPGFVILLMSFLLTLLSAYFPYTLLVDIWLKISMIFPVLFAVILTKNLTRVESRGFLRVTMYNLVKSGGTKSESFFREVFLPTFEEHIYDELERLMIHATKQKDVSSSKLYEFHSTSLAAIEETGR